MRREGRVTEAARDAEAPFAVVTWFEPETEVSITDVSGYKALETRCDELRRSGNIFYAVRLDGHFKRVRTRAVNPPQPGTRLAAAAKAQSEFSFSEIDGSLIGLWSPGFSSAFSVSPATTSTFFLMIAVTAATCSTSRLTGCSLKSSH